MSNWVTILDEVHNLFQVVQKVTDIKEDNPKLLLNKVTSQTPRIINDSILESLNIILDERNKIVNKSAIKPKGSEEDLILLINSIKNKLI